jgi:hypothetical protein
MLCLIVSFEVLKNEKKSERGANKQRTTPRPKKSENKI